MHSHSSRSYTPKPIGPQLRGPSRDRGDRASAPCAGALSASPARPRPSNAMVAGSGTALTEMRGSDSALSSIATSKEQMPQSWLLPSMVEEVDVVAAGSDRRAVGQQHVVEEVTRSVVTAKQSKGRSPSLAGDSAPPAVRLQDMVQEPLLPVPAPMTNLTPSMPIGVVGSSDYPGRQNRLSLTQCRARSSRRRGHRAGRYRQRQLARMVCDGC